MAADPEDVKGVEEEKVPGGPLPEGIKRASEVPMKDRIATMVLVWTKDGKILMEYPNETHIALKMLTTVMSQLADNEMRKYREVQNMAAELGKKIVIPPSTRLPSFDPRFLRKPGDS